MTHASQREQGAAIETGKRLLAIARDHAAPFLPANASEDMRDQNLFHVVVTLALLGQPPSPASIVGIGMALGEWLGQQPPEIVEAGAAALEYGVNQGLKRVVQHAQPVGRA